MEVGRENEGGKKRDFNFDCQYLGQISLFPPKWGIFKVRRGPCLDKCIRDRIARHHDQTQQVDQHVQAVVAAKAKQGDNDQDVRDDKADQDAQLDK